MLPWPEMDILFLVALFAVAVRLLPTMLSSLPLVETLPELVGGFVPASELPLLPPPPQAKRERDTTDK